MDEAELVAKLNDHANAIVDLREALVDLASKVFWLYNANDFVSRTEAMELIHAFNETYTLVDDLEVIDPVDFDTLTPEMFDDPE